MPYLMYSVVSGKISVVEDTLKSMGQDSTVGIATDYRLDSLGIKSRWRRDFPHPSRPVLGRTQPPVQWVLGLTSWGKVAGAWR